MSPRRRWDWDPHWYPTEDAPEEEEAPTPIPGSRAAGADPHDAMGHAVDYAGQDCPRCRDQFNREMRDST